MKSDSGRAPLAVREAIARGSKTFHLASRLLPADVRDDVAVVYAWCRHVDDAIDDAPVERRAAALRSLEDELDAICEGRVVSTATARAFQDVLARRRIPHAYPRELLAGMAMDASGARYASLEDLLLYCWRVAGVVGLMMAHVLGVRSEGARRSAAHLGMAMQLTNICRDVVEDYALGRVYLPRRMLEARGAASLVPAGPGAPFPAEHRRAVGEVVRSLLVEAGRLYRSGASGIDQLPWRASLAVRAAQRLYERIGEVIARRSFDVTRGRAVVGWPTKLLLVAGVLFGAIFSGGWRRPFVRADLPGVTEFPHDVLPV